MRPKVSVIIPVWNQEELITRALESIPKRDDIEVIVINDASTDKTAEAIMNFDAWHGNKFYDFIYLKNEENRGVGYTINRGYDKAIGEYVVALGSDDYFYTDIFEQAMLFLDGTDMVYFNLRTNDGTIFALTPETKRGFCGSTKFMHREFLGDTRCPDKRAGEDYDLYMELLKKEPTEFFTNLIVKHYNFPREGSLYDNMVKQKRENQLKK